MHRGGLGVGAEVDADDAPGGRKGVDGLGVDEHQLKLRLAKVAGGGQAVEQGFGPIVQEGISPGGKLGPELAEEVVPKHGLHLRGHDARARIPEHGEIVRRGGVARGGEEGQERA